MSIFKIGQQVWCPKPMGNPQNFEANHIYTMHKIIEQDEAHFKEGWELSNSKGELVFAEKDHVKNLEDVFVCKCCGSDELLQPAHVDNLGNVSFAEVVDEDAFCPHCNTTQTSSFICNLKQYLEFEQSEHILVLEAEPFEGLERTMDIYAKKGTLVMVTEKSAKKGYESDSEHVKKHLTIGQVYTVEKTFVEPFSSEVFLVEFPNILFNTVNFVTISDENDQKHEEKGMFANGD